MKYRFIFFWLLCLIFFATVRSQPLSKPALDISVYSKWRAVDNIAISNDGKFVLYFVVYPYSLYSMPQTLWIKAIDNSWSEEISNVSKALFSNDNSNVIFTKSKDSLFIIDLSSAGKRFLANVVSFKVITNNSVDWLVFIERNRSDLVIMNLNTSEEQRFKGVELFSTGNNNSLIYLAKSKKENDVIKTVNYLKMGDSNYLPIWSTYEEVGRAKSNLTNFVFDESGQQFAFREETKVNDLVSNKLWYYKAGSDSAIQINDLNGMKSHTEYTLANIKRFSKDGKNLFIYLKNDKRTSQVKSAVSMDIWDYRDDVIQSQQLSMIKNVVSYLSVLNVENQTLLKLQNDGESLVSADRDDFIILDGRLGEKEERYWWEPSFPKYIIVSTKTGDRKNVNLERIKPSPDGKFVIGYSLNNSNDLCSYEFATGRLFNVSKSIPVKGFLNSYRLNWTKGIEPVCWIQGKPSLVVYDKYDIWQVDLSGHQKPICLTNQYGRHNNIQFRFARESDYRNGLKEGRFILKGFNLENKDDGYYSINYGKIESPQQLTTGPFEYDGGSSALQFPLKAKDKDIFIVKRSSASESPNYFWTRDLKTFNTISDVYPEKSYNWLKSELVTFKIGVSETAKGILYKPENFDSLKKYPVVFNYYEQLSDELNKYRDLGNISGSNINIPWLISNGYLVFMPDIYFKKSRNGESALQTILAARNHLIKYAWVDASRLGLFGHSFGGYETNYIVTHSNNFSAAIASSGTSNLISGYGALWSGGGAKQGYYEVRQGRMGGSLWEKRDYYIKGSPVLYIDQIKTPLLLVANYNDESVRFEQGLEMYLGLRRLKKAGWMLQYDEGGHGVNGDQFIDLTIRSQQFFDHYLKNAPAPFWMSRGIPARLKGIETGYAYDPSGNCGKDCKVCKMWNEKMKKDSVGTWKEIEEKKKSEHWQ